MVHAARIALAAGRFYVDRENRRQFIVVRLTELFNWKSDTSVSDNWETKGISGMNNCLSFRLLFAWLIGCFVSSNELTDLVDITTRHYIDVDDIVVVMNSSELS